MMILDIWNSYFCTAVKKRIEEILAAKNTTELVEENRTWKNWGPYGMERTGEQEQAKLWKIWTNIIWGAQFWLEKLDETRRRIKQFYNYCSQRAAHQFSFKKNF